MFSTVLLHFERITPHLVPLIREPIHDQIHTRCAFEAPPVHSSALAPSERPPTPGKDSRCVFRDSGPLRLHEISTLTDLHPAAGAVSRAASGPESLVYDAMVHSSASMSGSWGISHCSTDLDVKPCQNSGSANDSLELAIILYQIPSSHCFVHY
ncbi:uncharacterized protein N7458_010414 [Penicillium daleae]|uniref:Uncharacterized protein n=1 Tax=Penicillium daleae TaxID=63821 RepID=A0AAD6C112_9EURO|nr:uncharacterized protein N7458_010414 [Penicillium daleae]KAJ5439416.1 hypothetical protein N7458_010414 [Penicillium daleae]